MLRLLLTGCCLFILLLSYNESIGQSIGDTVEIQRDITAATRYKPSKVAIMSAIVPGLGQIYNKKYRLWKVPLIYAGLGVLTYFTIFNYHQFKLYKNAYLLNQSGGYISDPYLAQQSALSLQTNRDDFRRYFQLCALVGAGVYALQIIDAYVYAHLHEFDVSPDLALSVKPLFYANYNAELVGGLTLTLRFRQ